MDNIQKVIEEQSDKFDVLDNDEQCALLIDYCRAYTTKDVAVVEVLRYDLELSLYTACKKLNLDRLYFSTWLQGII